MITVIGTRSFGPVPEHEFALQEHGEGHPRCRDLAGDHVHGLDDADLVKETGHIPMRPIMIPDATDHALGQDRIIARAPGSGPLDKTVDEDEINILSVGFSASIHEIFHIFGRKLQAFGAGLVTLKALLVAGESDGVLEEETIIFLNGDGFVDAVVGTWQSKLYCTTIDQTRILKSGLRGIPRHKTREFAGVLVEKTAFTAAGQVICPDVETFLSPYWT